MKRKNSIFFCLLSYPFSKVGGGLGEEEEKDRERGTRRRDMERVESFTVYTSRACSWGGKGGRRGEVGLGENILNE